SGEIDRQKQAADMMAKALEKEGMTLTHIIGPKTGHSYEKNAKEEVNRRIDAIVEKGRESSPKGLKFETYTLRYNRAFWVTVDELEQHWERAVVDASIHDNYGFPYPIVLVKNVSAFTLYIPPGTCPQKMSYKPKVMVNRIGHELTEIEVS